MEDLTKYKKLTPIEMRERLQKLKGWTVENGRLEKEFRFQNFARAMVFVNKIVNPIEEYQNYPRILITYDRIHVSLFTNEAGAITVMDFEMAQQMEGLAGTPQENGVEFIKA